MEDRRKILIPVGSEPETPHFDAEETLLSARPVVPITHAESAPGFNNSQVRAPFYRRSLFLPLVVIAAVGIGLAAGLVIARYRYVQRNATPIVAQPAQAPVVNDTRTTATVQTPKDEQQAQAPALPEVKIEEKTTDDDALKGDGAKTAKPVASEKAEKGSANRDTERDDNARTNTTPREKRRVGDEDEGKDAPRAQRRERRVRERDDTADIPRRMERASEQINRIREIFEGRPQRP